MKTKIAAILLLSTLFWLFSVPLLFAPVNVSTSIPDFVDVDADYVFGPFAPKADSASAAADEGSTVAQFDCPYEAVQFTVWVRNRAAADSLLVTLQTSPDPTDSALWQTVTGFGGRIFAAGFTNRKYSADVDSTRILYRYFRITHDHSPGTLRYAGPTEVDSSRWYFFVSPAGQKRK